MTNEQIATVPKFTEEDMSYLHNVLNEVLNGFQADLQSIGTTHNAVANLFKSLEQRKINDEKSIHTILLEPHNWLLLRQCSVLCQNEFEDIEFETRIGHSKTKAQAVDEKLLGDFE